MNGLSDYIASMSVTMSQNRLQTDASLAILKNAMDTQEAAGAKLIEDLSEMAPSAGGKGALLNIRA